MTRAATNLRAGPSAGMRPQAGPSARSLFVLSDLHVFSSHSRWETLRGTLHAGFRSADYCVFCGDTFEIKWTPFKTIQETVERAVAIVTEFAESAPHCQFHFVLGNHDHVQEFTDALDVLKRRARNVHWHPYHLRLGSAVFLHGDAADWRMTPTELAARRIRRIRYRRPGLIWRGLYDGGFRLGLHVAATRAVFPLWRTLRHLSSYLDAAGHGSGDGVCDVYFGHTHIPIHGVRFRGLTFHNGGAPLRWVPFKPLAGTIVPEPLAAERKP